MGYPIAIWEQIRSIIRWKVWTLVENITKEIAAGYSLRELHGIYPVPWQLREVLKQRADNWVQRLYDLCCDAYKAGGNKELSREFDLAVWPYCVEPFITREEQTTEEGYRASQLLELLLCAVGSTPEKRRALKVGQKDCCLAVQNEINQDWYRKLHHLPSKLDEAVAAMSRYNAIERRAALARGLSPEEYPSPVNVCPGTPAAQTSVVNPSPDPPRPSEETTITKPADPQGQSSHLPTPTVKPKNSAAENWQSIEILFVSDHRIQIRINGKSMETLNFSEFGFSDGRTQNPNKAWELLRVLAEQRGTIRDGKVVGEQWSKVEKRIQDIRRVLREYFGLSDDPIPFVEGTGYQTLFKIRCTPSFRT